MPAFKDQTQVATATCPNGHPVKITLGQARRSQAIRCPRCSGSIAIDGRSVDRELRRVDREWERLQQTLKKFNR